MALGPTQPGAGGVDTPLFAQAALGASAASGPVACDVCTSGYRAGANASDTDRLLGIYQGVPTLAQQLADVIRPLFGSKAQSIADTWNPTSGQIVFRVWGGLSTEFGMSWTPLDPQFAGKDYRSLAGLPSQNFGTDITIGRLTNPTGVTFQFAPPIYFWQKGGWPEYIVPDAQSRIQTIDRANVVPPY